MLHATHKYTHTRGITSHRSQVEDNNRIQFELPLPLTPALATHATSTTLATATTTATEAQAETQRSCHKTPKNSIRMPLKCGSSDVGTDRTTGCPCFRLPSKPIIFSCYICISKKSNGTNPNSTKDEQILKYDQPASLESCLCLCLCVWFVVCECGVCCV